MKKISKYVIAIALLFSVSVSCTDILDQKAVDSFNDASVFTDFNLSKAYIDNCYKNIAGNTDYILGLNRRQIGCQTDQLLSTNGAGSMLFTKGTLSPDNFGHLNDGYQSETKWSNLYTNIKNANVFIANMDKLVVNATATQAKVDQLKGEAYFIRAYGYYLLMAATGGVVLVDKPFELGQDYLTIKRSSLKETRDFILADLDKAISLLPKKTDAVYQQGRASKGAAAALKVRMLLFCASDLVNGGYEPNNNLVSFTDGTRLERLTAARDAAKLIMDGTYGTYSLAGKTTDPPAVMTDAIIKEYADNYSNIFLQKGTWIDESIWGVDFDAASGWANQWNLHMGPSSWHLWGNLSPLEDAVRTYEMADGTPFKWDAYNPGNQVLRTATAAELAADPKRNPYNFREPRFYGTIFFHGATWVPRPSDMTKYYRNSENKIQTGSFYKADGTTLIAFGMDTRQAPTDKANASKTAYFLKKFQDPAVDGVYYKNTNSYIDFRYAEILLSYAEVCIELGGTDLQKGLDALNMVRNRAGLPDRITADQAQARTWVRHERDIELFAELPHWYDIRRWMTVSTVLTDVRGMLIKEMENGNMEWKVDMGSLVDDRTWNPVNIWLPIPRVEINKAPQLQQNPGYN
jgi:starch-binding outer membrane protein, SusD/RagB family